MLCDLSLAADHLLANILIGHYNPELLMLALDPSPQSEAASARADEDFNKRSMAVKKSAASAASLEGFSSRDQSAASAASPAAQKNCKKMDEKLPFWVLYIGGWGEASLQGQSTPTGRSFRPVRACGAQCYSCRIRDEMCVQPPSLFPFGRGGISLFPSEFVSWSLSEQV